MTEEKKECPECGTSNLHNATHCRRCKTRLSGAQLGDACEHCGERWTQQIAGHQVCVRHYLEYQERFPELKPATVLAAEAYFIEHKRFHRQDGESKGEYMRRLAELRSGNRPGSQVGAEGETVGVAKKRAPRVRSVRDGLDDNEWFQIARAEGLV